MSKSESKKYNKNEQQIDKIIIKRNYSNKNRICFRLYLIITMILFSGQIFYSNKNRFLESKTSFIKLTIKNSGNIKIFCSNSTLFKNIYFPDEVYINEVTLKK